MKLTSTKDGLPNKECWCLVWAPKHPGWSRDRVAGGYLFSKFSPNYKVPWSVEMYCPDCVEYWMELPEPPADATKGFY